MNTNQPELGHFEQRLLTSLHAHDGTQAAATRRRTIGLAGAAAAMAIIGAVAIPQLTASPSFAVEEQADGAVTVTVRELADTQALEDALRAQGVNAEVGTLDGMIIGPPPAGAVEEETSATAEAGGSGDGAEPAASAPAGDPSGESLSVEIRDDGSATFTIPADVVDAGELVTIRVAEGDEVLAMSVEVG